MKIQPIQKQKYKKEFITIKNSLKNIIINQEKIKEVNQLVCLVNEIITRTYLFMRLYIISKYNYIEKSIVQ